MQAFIVENGVVAQSLMVPSADWPVEAGQTLVIADEGGIGWLYDGETLTPPVGEVVVPQEISALDGLLTLDAAGLSSAYHAWANSPDRTFAEKAFIDKAMTWKRQDPTILAAADALGLSAEQVDELFTQAAQQ